MTLETKVLNQAVKRNIKRFPDDFMFRLTNEEWNLMRSQIVTASQNKRNTNITPFAFTEQGIAMLSGVLHTDVAIHVNIAIMRTFVMIRKFALQHKDFSEKLLELESKYDRQFNEVYEALKYLVNKDQNPKQTLRK